MPALIPPAAAGSLPVAASWGGTAPAGAALYLLLFALSLWGIWALVRSGPAGADGASGPRAGGPPSDREPR